MLRHASHLGKPRGLCHVRVLRLPMHVHTALMQLWIPFSMPVQCQCCEIWEQTWDCLGHAHSRQSLELARIPPWLQHFCQVWLVRERGCGLNLPSWYGAFQKSLRAYRPLCHSGRWLRDTFRESPETYQVRRVSLPNRRLPACRSSHKFPPLTHGMPFPSRTVPYHAYICQPWLVSLQML